MPDYEILGQVASTRTGAVWKARDTRLDRLVALKELGAGPAAHEAAALAALSSEHVVQVFGVVADGPRSYLMEEWVEGASLAAVLRAAGRMSPQQALGCVRGALIGLAAAHSAGLVHGDVSLSNILIASDGTAKVVDFGSVVRTGERAGAATGAFAAPEARAGDVVTPATDVYAAAAVLIVLLTQRYDVQPSTRGIERPLGEVLDIALSADPGRRYPDATAFLAALEDAAQRRHGPAWWTSAGLGASATTSVAALLPTGPGAPFSGHGSTAAAVAAPPPPEAPIPPASRTVAPRRALLVGAVAAAALLAAIIVAVAATSQEDEQAALSIPPGPTSTPSSLPSSLSSSSPRSVTSSSSSSPPVAALTGRYRVREVIASVSGTVLPPPYHIGSVLTGEWRVRSSCAGGACTATVRITGTVGVLVPRVTLRWTGSRWVGAARARTSCVDGNSGAVLGGIPLTVTYLFDPPPSATSPRRFTGRVTQAAGAAAACRATRIVYTTSWTRIG